MITMDIVNLYENYNNYFNEDLKFIFEQCSEIASKNGFNIYLIGGIVRDLLLGLENLDIDITVEGNAIQFAKLLEKDGLARVISTHEDFGTTKVEIKGQKIDFASTRSEAYPRAGHLPFVTEIGCSLEKDVVRRDFTVNSLAISLNRDNFACLIDYVGGFEDLKAGKIKVLHDKSFIDDPTRIIRGLKYSTRLGFELDSYTHKLQKEYLENINYDMCYKRVMRELELTLGLNSDKCFNVFIEQNIYKLICENEIKPPTIGIANLVKKYEAKELWLVYLGFVLLKVQDIEPLLAKLELTKKEKNIVLNAKKLLALKPRCSDFEIYKAFEGKDIESLLILAVLGKEEKVLRYLEVLREIKLSVDGEDLLEMGIVPSKVFKEAFDFVLKIKLETPDITSEEEKKLLIKYIGL